MIRLVGILAVAISLAACNKKSGEAIVLGKEHIAAADKVAPSPAPDGGSEQTLRPLREEEITVDQYVMKPEVRGTSKDPRAFAAEHWRIAVRMVESGRQFNVLADQSQWEKMKPGDRVKVRYSEGKYTGTVWGAEIR